MHASFLRRGGEEETPNMDGQDAQDKAKKILFILLIHVAAHETPGAAPV